MACLGFISTVPVIPTAPCVCVCSKSSIVFEFAGRCTVHQFNGGITWSSNPGIVRLRGGVPPFSVHLAPSPAPDSLCVTKSNSRLQLLDGNNKTVLQTRRFFGKAPFQVQFLNTGRLIVKDSKEKICWMSGVSYLAPMN